MPIIDERGRVFGRLNLVDAAVGILVLLLLPAAYLSYAVFKEPAAKLTAVVPSVLPQAAGRQIEVRGEHFRPYMRVSFNQVQGRTFMFYAETSAFVQLPDLPPGTYDVVLYDYQQEVSRLRGAITIQPPPAPPTVEVEVSGVLTSITPAQVKSLAIGYRFPEGPPVYSELVAMGAAEPEVRHVKTGDRSTLTLPASGLLQIPVRIRMRCVLEKAADGMLRCLFNGVPLVTDANVAVPGFGQLLNFRVSEVMASAPK